MVDQYASTLTRVIAYVGALLAPPMAPYAGTTVGEVGRALRRVRVQCPAGSSPFLAREDGARRPSWHEHQPTSVIGKTAPRSANADQLPRFRALLDL